MKLVFVGLGKVWIRVVVDRNYESVGCMYLPAHDLTIIK